MLVAGVLLAIAAGPAAAQSKTTTKVDKYDNGAVKTQTTTTTSADGKTKGHEVRTQYDKDGRPTHESDITYEDGVKETQRHERTWVYDDKGRLIYFEATDWTGGNSSVVPGVESKYRIRKSYNGDRDSEGSIESEQTYTSVVPKWRDVDIEGGDTRPDMKPLQPLPEKPKPAAPKAVEPPKPETPQVPPPTRPLGEPSKKPSSPHDEGLPDPPPPKVRIYGKVSFEHTPNEASENNFGGGGVVAYSLMPRLSVVGEMSLVGGSGSTNQHFTRLNLLGGAEWTFPRTWKLSHDRRAQPFARAMAGMVRDRTTEGEFSFNGNGFVVAVGVGITFNLRGRVGAVAGFDYAPTHFTGAWQQALMVSGGVSYDFLPADAGGSGGGDRSVPAGLENPYTNDLSKYGEAVRQTKGPNDKAQAEIEKADAEWVKKNLTPEGQKDLQDARKVEQVCKAEFDKAADDLARAQREDARLQTQQSSDEVAKARAILKKADTTLKSQRRERIRVTKRGFTKAAQRYYEKIFDAHWQATQQYDEAKRLWDQWNKAHGVKGT